MWQHSKKFAILITLMGPSFVSAEAGPAAQVKASLWQHPADIDSRDLIYGAGGKAHAPSDTTFTFVKEDLSGSKPKYVVVDKDGVRWKVKLGAEARPEIVSTRFVWAVGYYTDEDYFLPCARIQNMPATVHRGRQHVAPDGSVRNVRLERMHREKDDMWRWRKNPFSDTAELNGLRVLMALLHNWDVKDQNNAIYEETGAAGPSRIYVVSDLGATFGATKYSWPNAPVRGNSHKYKHSKFIRYTAPDYVDLVAPDTPVLLGFMLVPDVLVRRLWIGKHIPRDHAKWIGQWLARLSPTQIRDAFRSAQYPSEDVEAFSRVVESRIAQLNDL